jgi:hypothetical protein
MGAYPNFNISNSQAIITTIFDNSKSISTYSYLNVSNLQSTSKLMLTPSPQEQQQQQPDLLPSQQ